MTPNPNDDPDNRTVAQYLAERAVRMTDDPTQLTLFAYESEEALVLVLRVRRTLLHERRIQERKAFEAPLIEVP